MSPRGASPKLFPVAAGRRLQLFLPCSGDRIRRLPCKHEFHCVCVGGWQRASCCVRSSFTLVRLSLFVIATLGSTEIPLGPGPWARLSNRPLADRRAPNLSDLPAGHHRRHHRRRGRRVCYTSLECASCCRNPLAINPPMVWLVSAARTPSMMRMSPSTSTRTTTTTRAHTSGRHCGKESRFSLARRAVWMRMRIETAVCRSGDGEGALLGGSPSVWARPLARSKKCGKNGIL